MATVGVDLGGTKCLGVAVSGGELVAEAQVPTPRGEDTLLATMVELITSLGAEAGTIEAVGVGVPGLVDRDGVLRVAPNLPGVVGLPVRRELQSRLGVPVQVDNDATCAAWGERQMGAAQGLDEVVLVTLGTGIGGGIVSGGTIHRGANGFAGEVGHMVVDPHGPPCPCGQRGCWERFASGSGLGRLAREAALAGRVKRSVELAGGDPELVRGEHVSAALAEGDPDAQDVMTEFAWWLALGLVNLANIFDPQAFVIGGGMVTAGPPLFDAARAAFDDMLLGRAPSPAQGAARAPSPAQGAARAPSPAQGAARALRPAISITPAALGPRAGAIGAAFLAAEASP